MYYIERRFYNMKIKHEKLLKTIKLILLILTIIILIFLSIKLFPLFSNLGTKQGQEEFKAEISNSGFNGVLTIIGLQFLQILIPVLPGEPIEFLAGMCYGTIGGMLIIFLGAFLSSILIFYCVRFFR